jgi:lysophospholipid acyltransferase (LPLAT)-like uncharacterized protein
MLKRFTQSPFGRRLIAGTGALIFRAWFASCRISITGRDYHEKHILGPNPIIGATWHRNAIFLVWFFRKQHPMIMFSKSRDGDLLAGFAQRLGIIPARGSSSRGGREALRQMRAFLKMPGPRKVATVLDGPRGPRCQAKIGMLTLARGSAVPLLPIMMSAKPAITLGSTWDRTLIPLPFSKVVVAYRRPWRIGPETRGAALDNLREEVELTLNAMMAAADKHTGYRPPV